MVGAFLQVNSIGAKNGLVARNVILFDGVCNFCNFWVDTVKRLDTDQKFHYTALQSKSGKRLLGQLGKQSDDLSTVVFIRKLYDTSNDKKSEVFIKSDAALQVAAELGIPPQLINTVGLVFPKSFRDTIYDYVAKNRYNILGKRESCNCGEVLSESDEGIEVEDGETCQRK